MAAKRRVYADTNIIIRYLTNDPLAQAEVVERFLSHLGDGKTELFVCDLVAAESVYVLQSFYRRPKAEITDRLKAFFSLPGIVVQHRRIVYRALDLYVSHNIDFTDAYVGASAQFNKVKEVLTFDKDFRAFEWLSIVEK